MNWLMLNLVITFISSMIFSFFKMTFNLIFDFVKYFLIAILNIVKDNFVLSTIIIIILIFLVSKILNNNNEDKQISLFGKMKKYIFNFGNINIFGYNVKFSTWMNLLLLSNSASYWYNSFFGQSINGNYSNIHNNNFFNNQDLNQQKYNPNFPIKNDKNIVNNNIINSRNNVLGKSNFVNNDNTDSLNLEIINNKAVINKLTSTKSNFHKTKDNLILNNNNKDFILSKSNNLNNNNNLNNYKQNIIKDNYKSLLSINNVSDNNISDKSDNLLINNDMNNSSRNTVIEYNLEELHDTSDFDNNINDNLSSNVILTDDDIDDSNESQDIDDSNESQDIDDSNESQDNDDELSYIEFSDNVLNNDIIDVDKELKKINNKDIYDKNKIKKNKKHIDMSISNGRRIDNIFNHLKTSETEELINDKDKDIIVSKFNKTKRYKISNLTDEEIDEMIKILNDKQLTSDQKEEQLSKFYKKGVNFFSSL